jgi:hypothetical protein
MGTRKNKKPQPMKTGKTSKLKRRGGAQTKKRNSKKINKSRTIKTITKKNMGGNRFRNTVQTK